MYVHWFTVTGFIITSLTSTHVVQCNHGRPHVALQKTCSADEEWSRIQERLRTCWDNACRELLVCGL